MKLAYLISVHTEPEQLRRLVDALHPDAHFFVHVDRKSALSSFVSLLSRDNVHFIADRVDAVWGTIRQVDYQMALIRAALDYPIAFERIFFLSGLDYPLWSNERIEAWLQARPDREFMAGYCMDTPALSPEQRSLYQTARPFLQCPVLGGKANERLRILGRILYRVLRRRKELSFVVDGKVWRLYKGSDWWCVSCDLLSYIYSEYTTHPEVRRYFSDAFAPSETLPQTIAFNSPLWASRCILHGDPYPGLAALTPLHFIDYNPVIKVMDESDYGRLMASGKMFARKFTGEKSQRLMALIDAHRLSATKDCKPYAEQMF